eukprot:UC1_evm1s1760
MLIFCPTATVSPLRVLLPFALLLLCTVPLLVSSTRKSGTDLRGRADSLHSKFHERMPLAGGGRTHSVDITDFGAVGDGKTVNTAAFEKAVGRCASLMDCQLNVPPGIWVTAPFNLTSHFTLNVSSRAKLVATTDPATWPIIPALPSYGQGRDHPGPRRTSFLHGEHLRDVILTGGGVVDGQGQSWWARHKARNETYTRGRLFELMWTDGILLEDLTFINSPFWTLHPTYSSNIVARRLTIINPNDSPNTDGFDPDSCENVTLVDSFFNVGDDGVAIKSGWDCFGIETNVPTRNVYIRNLTVNSPCCAGICIGSEMSGGVENVVVEDCHFHSVGQGLRIKAGLGRGAFVRNISYENVVMDNWIHNAIE